MQLVSIRTAAKHADISTRTIENLISDGRLTRYKLTGGAAVRIDLDELLALFVPTVKEPPR
ncbi:helix-turn-helix domain-containing protein [Kocuria marina]|uniref:helix-turn-helix domain-containing protein n=1 Tax=Kocuria marina TaxID=223184 RepID=UPI0021A6EF2D|nr:helix-turn-helix domain-containing protein [Kocuria marina]MCT1615729.1 helix-turn-helix domain-containing protein [Kocuria marina]